MKQFKQSLFPILGFLLIFGLGCQSDAPSTNTTSTPKSTTEVNVYTHRHYDTDKKLFAEFEKTTGIKVNVVKAGADELMNRMQTEGENSPADVLITVDAGRLVRAKTMNLLQAVSSETLQTQVPARYRDADNHWFGLTKRARIAAYSKERVKPTDLSTYQDLTNAKWKGRLLIRSSGNIYNQSLLASIIANQDEVTAKNWAAGMVVNMARPPKGNDRDQVKAIAQGTGDVAIVNTYYIGKLLTSDNEEERKAGQAVGLAFLTHEGGGTHINVSGIGVAKHAPNKANAVKLIEFLTAKAAQTEFAAANFEYPVHPDITPSELLQSWGNFEEDGVDLSKLGEFNSAAVKIYDEVGWK